MKNYQCSHCNSLIQQESRPNNSNCSSSSYHYWNDLGETGGKNYKCQKCELVLKSEKHPSTSGCSKATYHQWSEFS